MSKAEQKPRQSSTLKTLWHKLIGFIFRFYRYAISPYLGNNCRFYPSCSSYAEQAIKQEGLIKGGWLSIKRISKCHPWHPGGVDPVPPKKHKALGS